MSPRCLIDGVASDKVSVDDRGLHYGDGVFETIAAPAGRLELLQAHLDRLARGAKVLGLGSIDFAALHADILSLLTPGSDCVIKVIVTRGSGGRGYQPPPDAGFRRIVSVHDWPRQRGKKGAAGAQAITCKTRLPDDPQFAGIKTLCRLHNVVAAREIRDAGADEGVMLDQTGHVVCGTMSNVFIFSNGKLITPDVSRCGIAGIVREKILGGAASLGIDACVESLKPADLETADEIFVSNSVIGIWPVTRLDDCCFDTGAITRACRDWLLRDILERKP